jgi:hypothetical protein
MTCTLTNTHRSGHQPSRARFDGAIGQAWQCRNATDAWPAASTFDGILAVLTMWTKSTARHLAPRST